MSRLRHLKLEAFQKALGTWYRAHHRDLPWRACRDPYRIWVSETMLQQTQVATVIPYYTQFIKRFSSVQSLAAADVNEVLSFWSGLGYYRRVRNLHEAARLVVRNHRGRIPRRREELTQLPGVGRYTAGAILSFAFDQREAILDGNVTRILCRIFEIHGNPKVSVVSRRLWHLAAAVLPDEGVGDFNQALMELGATLCLPQKPLCMLCPVRTYCLSRKKGNQESLPEKAGSGRGEKQVLAAVIIYRGKRLLMQQRDHPSLMTGLWELPTVELGAGQKFRLGGVLGAFQEQLGFQLSRLREIGRVSHAITYRRITLYVCRATLSGTTHSLKAGPRSSRWILPEELNRFGVSSLVLKALRLLH